MHILKAYVILLVGIVAGILISTFILNNRGLSGIFFQLSPTSKESSSDYTFDQTAYLDQFPKVRDGFRRYIIPSPKNDLDTLWHADILVGKYQMADCNSKFIEVKNMERKSDWTGNSYRYDYYEIETSGPAGSTEIGCASTLKFDIVENEKIPKNLDFHRQINNEYYPIVVDVNGDFEIGYRLWNVDQTVERAKEVK